jgi:pimeloyl-ACP methyl ester carboxylesterase
VSRLNEIKVLQTIERLVDLGLERLDQAVLPPPDPTLPAVILLPGFMGVHLANSADGRVWLDPAAAIRGDLSARVALDASGAADAFPGERLAADGVVRFIYADLIQALRFAGHAVHPFAFDFRRSIVSSTLLLRDFVTDILRRSPDSRVVLVGHSMGSLLACLLPYHLPAFADRVQQTIFLGGPLGGCFETVEAVTGTHWVLPRLVALSARDTSRDFQASLATWPGALSMLADPDAFPGAGCERAFDAAAWPAGLAPRQAILDEVMGLKTTIRQSPLFRLGRPVTQLIATRYSTVGSLARDGQGAIVAGPRTCQGDGVVTAASALPPGVVGYRTAFPHTLAPVEPAAIQAILDLIQTGACALAPIQRHDVTARVAPGVAPEMQIAFGLIESGVASVLDGCLTLSSVTWLLASMR